MPIEYIYHNGNKYLASQAIGNAAQWIMPLALHHCKGRGLDIGFSKIEWKLPGAIGIDECLGQTQNAMNIMDSEYNYIFSSHMLEHLQGNWADCLDYWLSKLRDGGVLFLYLPHKSQTYWHPTSNRKHVHSFDGSEIKTYLEGLGYEPYVTPVDYNNSFAVICYKEKVDKFAELKEEFAKAQKIPFVMQYDNHDSHGDVLMPGCFDKSIDALYIKFNAYNHTRSLNGEFEKDFDWWFKNVYSK